MVVAKFEWLHKRARKWPRRPPSTADLIRHLWISTVSLGPLDADLGTPSRVGEILCGRDGLGMAMGATIARPLP
jgi:hypothetical protein